jgi:hypothetical protein
MSTAENEAEDELASNFDYLVADLSSVTCSCGDVIPASAVRGRWLCPSCMGPEAYARMLNEAEGHSLPSTPQPQPTLV